MSDLLLPYDVSSKHTVSQSKSQGRPEAASFAHDCFALRGSWRPVDPMLRMTSQPQTSEATTTPAIFFRKAPLLRSSFDGTELAQRNGSSSPALSFLSRDSMLRCNTRLWIPVYTSLSAPEVEGPRLVGGGAVLADVGTRGGEKLREYRPYKQVHGVRPRA